MAAPGRPLVETPADDAPALLAALERALDGSGSAVLPRGSGPVAAGPPLPERLGREWSEDACLVVETSGSTSAPKRVVLEASALRASARATDRRLDELAGRDPGDDASRQWLLTLPGEYIAGAQVLVRSILAGTAPVVHGLGGFDAAGFVADAARMTGERRYTSLVPVQLARLLKVAEGAGDDVAEADAERTRDAVARFDAILVGGQSTPELLRQRARRLGWRVVTTYGASETAGGCAYDGVPLAGVEALDVEGELRLAGPVLAAGYLGDPERTDDTFVVDDRGVRWYRTGDAGEFIARHTSDPAWQTGRIRITGRLDDVLVSGGEKVLVGRVERLVRSSSVGLDAAVVVAAPSTEWGQVPAVVAEGTALRAAGLPAPTAGADPEAGLVELGAAELASSAAWRRLRETVGEEAGRASRPARLFAVGRLPALASGKPDRVRLARDVGDRPGP